MNRVLEIKHWLQEGNLYRAEKAIQTVAMTSNPMKKKNLKNSYQKSVFAITDCLPAKR